MTTTRRSTTPGGFKFSVRRSAAGLGLFAEQDIPKGACVIEYTGRLLKAGEEKTSRSRYLFEISATKTIDGFPRSNTARYINHSCRPNCEPDIKKGRIFIYARRKVRAGEELNYDYGKAYFNQLIKGGCRCAKCKPALAAKLAKKRVTRSL